MYKSYSFHTMKPKADRFRSTSVSSTSSYTYDGWQNYIDGSSAYNWPKLLDRYGENIQLSILTGATVVGISDNDCESVFRAIYHESSPFQGLAMAIMKDGLTLSFTYFADKLAKETYRSIHYPSLCPEWLFPFGYTQRMYLADLSVYWDNIHDDYYKPWETTRLGQDSPEIARLRKIGQEARSEIDSLARHSSKKIRH